MKKMVEYPFK